jgi:hypothetical protein
MADDLASVDETSEIAAHVAAYHKFSLLVKWVMVMAGTIISSLAVCFATPGGFWGGLVVGVVVFAAGTFALRHGWAHSSEAESLVYPQGRRAA